MRKRYAIPAIVAVAWVSAAVGYSHSSPAAAAPPKVVTRWHTRTVTQVQTQIKTVAKTPPSCAVALDGLRQIAVKEGQAGQAWLKGAQSFDASLIDKGTRLTNEATALITKVTPAYQSCMASK